MIAVKPLVSVCMITYNHELFISQAIEGVLMQQCSYPIELVIGEDCSEDKTRLICRKYASNHSNIRLLPTETNMGMLRNFVRTLQACSGKYIALCEGDDYWSDPMKLHKQVNFMEINDDLALSHTNFIISDELKGGEETPSKISQIGAINTDYLIQVFNIRTCTAIIRNYQQLLEDFPSSLPYGDYPLFLKASLFGKIGFMEDFTAVYRRNLSGITQRGNYRFAELNRLKILDWFKSKNPQFERAINYSSAFLIEKYLYKIRNMNASESLDFTIVFLYMKYFICTMFYKEKFVKLNPLSFIKSFSIILRKKKFFPMK
jgi:glycosyltransferase involved in cell wall biosynthesis